MRRLQAALALTGGLLLIGTAAVAHAPVVTITSPTDGDLVQLDTTEFPYTLPVAGTVTHDPGSVKLTVSVNGVEEFDGQWQNASNQPWGFDYTVLAPGTYTIVALAEHGPASDEDSVAIEIEETRQTVVVDYPAAPAVAADILKEKGVAARYGSGKKGGNYISDVAAYMGPQTDFDAVSKSEVEAYRAKVSAFLDEQGAF